MSPKLLRLMPLCGIFLLAAGCAYSADPDQSPPPLPKTVSPNLAKVKPPLKPTISPFFISDKDLDKLPEPTQPKALHDALADLAKGTIEERVAKLKAKVIADLVYVQGGSFMRGDFAKLMGVPGVTRMTYNEDDKDVRKITLSDFWISRYKTTYAEFDVFTDATGRQRTGMEHNGSDRNPFIPAGTYWQGAKDYCQWLGKITGYPFDLPTEAQWEYAARSRGQFFMIATDDGNIEYGRNIPYAAQAERLSPPGSFAELFPVGMFPPNPLGLYDMSYDGQEWVNDWYAPDTYAKASNKDPKGPANGTEKVVRGWSFGDTLKIGANVWRRKLAPIPMVEDIPDNNGNQTMAPLTSFLAPSVRCIVMYR
jgi:sulfatase modifying factor 1